MVSSLSPQPVMDRPVPLASPVARRRHPALVPWIVLGLVAVLDAVWLTCAGVGLTATQLPSLLLRVALRGGLLGETLLRFLALTTSAGILSYLVLTLHRPLIDPLLAQADAALGVPYMAWFVWVEAHPQVAELLTSAYLTTWLQLVVCLVVLALGQQRARLQELFWAIALALGVILPLSGAFPAQSAWVTYGLTARVPPWAMQWYPLFHGFQTGILRTIDLTSIEGLITFPSFHTTMGILLTASLRPYRLVFPLALALNALMIVSVPTQGGHYVVDVLAGAVVAGLALWGAQWLLQGETAVGPRTWRRRFRPDKASATASPQARMVSDRTVSP